MINFTLNTYILNEKFLQIKFPGGYPYPKRSLLLT